MNRVIARSAAGAITALICISLSGCVLSNAAPAQAPSTPPPELSIEEHACREGPDLEPLTFVPVEGTQEEILDKHRARRASSPRTPCQPDCEASLRDHNLTATTFITDTTGRQRVVAQVFQDEHVIHALQLGDPCAVPPLWGLWSFDEHWVLEAACAEARREGSTAYCESVGCIILDGESLNEQRGYQESFGFQLMNGRPFYFFQRQDGFGVSYDGYEIPLRYSHISHYQCCSRAALNLRSSGSMVAFFAQRGGTGYYVEIGAFERDVG